MGNSWSRNSRDNSRPSRPTTILSTSPLPVEHLSQVCSHHSGPPKRARPRPVKKLTGSPRLPLIERSIGMLGGHTKAPATHRDLSKERRIDKKKSEITFVSGREDKENQSMPHREVPPASLKAVETGKDGPPNTGNHGNRRGPSDAKETDRGHQSPGRLRKLLKRRHSTKVSPEVLNEVNGIPSTPTTPKELLPQPVKQPELDLAAIDTNKNHVGKVATDPKPVMEFHAEEGFISVTQLFNSVAYGQPSPYLFESTFLLLIDTRSRAEYCFKHIATARHVDDLDNPELVKSLNAYTLIVVYDADGKTHALADSVLSKTLRQIHAQGQELFILQGGYQAFEASHQYLCSSKVIYTERERHLLTNYPSIIVEDQIYLGRGDQATNMKIIQNLGITHVLNITREHPNAFPNLLSYMQVQLDDDNSANLLPEFGKTTKFLQEAIENGGRVLVHCNLGVSRSSTVLIAFLMATRHWSLTEAYHFVKEHRPVVHPNKAFWSQLTKHEELIFGKK